MDADVVTDPTCSRAVRRRMVDDPSKTPTYFDTLTNAIVFSQLALLLGRGQGPFLRLVCKEISKKYNESTHQLPEGTYVDQFISVSSDDPYYNSERYLEEAAREAGKATSLSEAVSSESRLRFARDHLGLDEYMNIRSPRLYEIVGKHAPLDVILSESVEIEVWDGLKLTREHRIQLGVILSGRVEILKSLTPAPAHPHMWESLRVHEAVRGHSMPMLLHVCSTSSIKKLEAAVVSEALTYSNIPALEFVSSGKGRLMIEDHVYIMHLKLPVAEFLVKSLSVDFESEAWMKIQFDICDLETLKYMHGKGYQFGRTHLTSLMKSAYVEEVRFLHAVTQTDVFNRAVEEFGEYINGEESPHGRQLYKGMRQMTLLLHELV